MDNYKPYFDIADLIAKHLRNNLTDNEKIELTQWRKSSASNEELFQKLTDQERLHQQLDNFQTPDHKLAWDHISSRIGFPQQSRRVSVFKSVYPYAAAILLLAGIGLANMHWVHKKTMQAPLVLQRKDILPGSNKATLTLADGSKVVLENPRSSKIGKEKKIDLNKTHNGELVYRQESSPRINETPASTIIIPTNIITTPRGGQYAVVLPDGTKVWLNAASSLKYPTAFPGARRQVELTGEAYFEVAKNPSKPFLVKTASQTVEVLGTHFNINSYTDEKATTTTLLEGSVRITGNLVKSEIKLKPGEQSTSSSKGLQLAAHPAIDEAMAWRSGKFVFNHTDLKSIMRQLSRWYDVDIEYKGEFTDKHYQGRVSRDVPVSQIFMILKTSGINFTISGGKIIVRS